MKKVIVDKDLLYHYYIKENNNIEKTANLMSISYRTIQRAIKEYGFNKDQNQKSITRKKTTQEKYGVENVYQLEEVKDKLKQTKQDRYGDANYNNSKKQAYTMLANYGVKCGYNTGIAENTIRNNHNGKMGCGAKDIQEKVMNTNLKRYGVPHFYLSKEAQNKNMHTISKINKEISKLLKENDIDNELEFVLKNKSYDIHILNTNILLEINPSYTHNSTIGARFSKFEKEPLSYDYHVNKTLLAKENNYRCIHIWDWDDIDKIIKMLKNKEKIYARKCIIKEVSLEETNKLLNDNHLQNTCKGQDIRLGLYYNNELIEIMTFGKPRYNKNYEYELLRLCTKSNYMIIGGTEKLFKYFIKKYNPKSIISYCDNSKFKGDTYIKLGFKLKDFGSPAKHWFNGKRHITDNLLRQRGFDQLFGANYGKGTSNEELMIEHNFVEIYDSGQSVYIWEKQD